MEDVPPGPTSPEPRRPLLSVVIPVHNGGRDFEHCLRRLRDSFLVDYELIVVDDGSTDDSRATAISQGARVLSNPAPMGPAAARNLGARAATSDLVFFLDADVALHPDALERAHARFRNDPGLTALFGSYDDSPRAPGLVSRFRNLLHHFVHQQGRFIDDARPARSFWTGCGMIRRPPFLHVGGFDPKLYTRPAIEDIELGYRLTRSGHRILLARDVLGTHLKRWTLGTMIRTDIFQRGVPWLILMRRLGVSESDLNVKNGQKVCVAATGTAILAGLASPFHPVLGVVAAACVTLIILLNPSFYRFLARNQGPTFAIASIPIHLLYYVCCGLSVVIALAYWHLGPRSARRGEPLAGPWGLRRRARVARRDNRDASSRSGR